MLYTNKMNIELNYQNIKEAFDIYYVEKRTGDFYRGNVLDHILYTFKARSVCTNGLNKLYVLLDKGTGADFMVQVTGEYPDTKVQEIVFNSKEELEEQVPNTDVILGRLLLNQMQQSNIESLRYNNISGNLLMPCHSKSKKIGDIDYKVFFEVKITTNSVLVINMKTFSTSDKGQYILDPITGVFRVRLSDDLPTTLYKVKAMRNTKSVVNFIDLTDPIKNEKTKMGQLDIILNDVEKKLADYMVITLNPLVDGIELKQLPSLSKKKQNERIINCIRQGGINVVDLINDENSPLDIRYIEMQLKEQYGIDTASGLGRYTI